MKILTLNTHSLMEENYEEKLKQFAEMVKKELPRVFALQEVNQSMSAEEVEKPEGYVSCGGGKFIGITSGTKGKSCIRIRKDNHAYRLSQLLRTGGLEYEWTWIGAKVGYGKYDEGLAVFSRTCILETAEFCISKVKDYSNWKTRKVLGIKAGIVPVWYFSIHMGWWDDKEEPFSEQWDCFCKHLSQLGIQKNRCYIMGDFNSPSNIPREGYEYIKKIGWYDTWQLAKEKDSGITVGKVIDGWKERIKSDEAEEGMRIDYIWCNEDTKVKYSKVICNGKNYPIVSDHYGIMIETDE